MSEQLTFDMILVMIMIGVAVFLFVVEWIRVDVVAILMMVTLPLLGLVTPTQAFIGLSSNAVVSIIAVIIIGAGLDKTAVINRLTAPIVSFAGKSANRIIIFISLTVAFISSFMQNIGAAALVLPAIQRISKSLKIPIGRLLMPIGFSAILGGTVTLVGSSPLILLNDLIIPFKLEPFGLFDVTPIGIALVAGGIGCFILLGRFILPQGEEAGSVTESLESTAAEAPRVTGEMFELHTPETFTHYREPVTVDLLRRRYLVNVLGLIEPPDYKVLAPASATVIRSDVDLLVYGRRSEVDRLAAELELELKPEPVVFRGDVTESVSGVVEAVVAPRSPLIGQTLKQQDFSRRFGVTPLAIYRESDIYRAEIGDVLLKMGDGLVLQGPWERMKYLSEGRYLLFATPLDVERMHPEKALLAAFWLVLALTMTMGFHIQLSVSLMTGALGMIITRVLSIDEAYQSVDWRTIFLLGGLIPLGIATEKTGTAAWIAHAVLNATGVVPPIVLLTIIALLSTVFTLVISNVGATVLLVPLVVNMALAAHADPRMAALVVGLATSNSFILPTHQVNALYMGPGHYRSVDFMKAGTLVSILFIVITIGMIWLVYGVS